MTKMEKTNITMYSDEELSLIVLNDEHLYNVFMKSVRRENFNYIIEEVEEMFTFTDEQKEDLREVWEAEVAEYNSEE